jgi:hypothetical protein
MFERLKHLIQFRYPTVNRRRPPCFLIDRPGCGSAFGSLFIISAPSERTVTSRRPYNEALGLMGEGVLREHVLEPIIQAAFSSPLAGE